MELALTHPEEGYYSRTGRLLGPRGDFTTAPRISEVFAAALGRLLEELIDAALVEALGEEQGPVALVELGGGEADLAGALLARWSRVRPDLQRRVSYAIVEVGQSLRSRQRRVLAGALREGWDVRWTATLGEAGTGAGERAVIVFSNEFVDALPIHLVDVRGATPVEAWVTVDARPGSGGTACEEWAGLSSAAEEELAGLFGTVDSSGLLRFTDDGFLELRPAVRRLMAEAGSPGGSVCLLTVDYGEWFPVPASPSATPGEAAEAAPGVMPGRRRSLRGYFKHQLVGDPYVRVGRQDLTADVDFGALDHHGRQAGLETVLFTTVAGLLRADGAEDRLERLRAEAAMPSPGTLESDRQGAALERLLDPDGPGGSFKVMLQVKEGR